MIRGGGLSRRSLLGLLAGAVAAPIVVRSGLLMPVKAPLQSADIWDVRFGDTPIAEFDGVLIQPNPAIVAARLFRSMGFPLNIPEVRKLARLCAEPVPPAGQLARASGHFAAGGAA
jgi:hypothetical protein